MRFQVLAVHVDSGLIEQVVHDPADAVEGDCGRRLALLERVEAAGYEYPFVIPDRCLLFEGCWRTQTTPWTYLEEHRAPYDYEREMLADLEELAPYIVKQVRGPEVTA